MTTRFNSFWAKFGSAAATAVLLALGGAGCEVSASDSDAVGTQVSDDSDGEDTPTTPPSRLDIEVPNDDDVPPPGGDDDVPPTGNDDPDGTGTDAEVEDPLQPNGGLGSTDTVVLTRDGKYIVSQSQTGQGHCLTYVQVEAPNTVSVREDYCNLRDIVSAEDGSGVAILPAHGRSLLYLETPDSEAVTWFESDNAYNKIMVSSDGANAVLGMLPKTPADIVAWEQATFDLDLQRVTMLDTATLDSHTFVAAHPVRDLDFSETTLIATMSRWDKFGLPKAVLQVLSLQGGEFLYDLEFNNCADDLQLQPEGTLAILAPQTCTAHAIIIEEPEAEVPVDAWENDPISVIDLESGQHLANTPGFGPVSFAPDGQSVVGFTVRDTLMVEWNYFQTEAFGIIVVDVNDFTWKVVDMGDERPDYFYGANNRVYASSLVEGAPYTVRVDPSTGEVTALSGAAVALRVRESNAEGSTMYVADHSSVFSLALGSGTVSEVLAAPADQLIRRPQGDLLIATDRSGGTHRLLDLNSGTLSSTIALPGPIHPL